MTNIIIETSFENAILDYADMSYLIFWGCNFKNASFIEVNLTHTKMIACDLRGATFEKAIMEKIDLRGSVYGEYQESESSILKKSKEMYPLKDFCDETS